MTTEEEEQMRIVEEQTFEVLPHEIVLEIFSFIDLNLSSLTNLENVCTTWREVKKKKNFLKEKKRFVKFINRENQKILQLH